MKKYNAKNGSNSIDDVNRLVYQVAEGELQIIACLYHYSDK